MVSGPLLIISNVAVLYMNFNFNSMVLYVLPSSFLIMAKSDISSTNGAFTLINFCSLGFSTIHSFGKMGRDLFKKLKQQSHEFITPSNLNTFLIPSTRFIFSWISDTSVYISNLCPCISTITRIMNSTLTN